MNRQLGVKVVAVVAILMVTVGAFFFVGKRILQSSKTTEQSEGAVAKEHDINVGNAVAQTSEYVLNEAEVQNWKKFEDPGLHFELRYPENWFYDDEFFAGGKLSPYPITLYPNGSHNAPINFGVLSSTLLSTGHSGGLDDEDASWKESPMYTASPLVNLQKAVHTAVSVGGTTFNRYEWDDGSYPYPREGGAGKQVIYTTDLLGGQVVFIMHWTEEYPKYDFSKIDSKGHPAVVMLPTSVTEEDLKKILATFKIQNVSMVDETPSCPMFSENLAIYQGRGIEVTLPSNYQSKGHSIGFGSSKLGISDDELPECQYAYELTFDFDVLQGSQKVEKIISDLEYYSEDDLISKPAIEKIHGLDVVHSVIKGNCGERNQFVVMGTGVMNYILENNDCFEGSSDSDEVSTEDYLKKMIGTIKFIQ